MEWMLQVVDDLDDAVNAVMHRCIGFNADLGVVVAGGVSIAAIAAGIALGAAPTVVLTAAAVLCIACTVKLHRLHWPQDTAA